MSRRYQSATYGRLKVAYLPHLDGGGREFGQSFVPVVRNLFGRVNRVFEFCAGPGFIGFSILAHGLCNSLCLADINQEAVDAARYTVDRNGLRDRVAVYRSDGLHDIPSTEQWDLVVSNPPHFSRAYRDSLRHHDPEWALHHHFYATIGRFLNASASILIQENYQGSDENDFQPMISDAPLRYNGAFMYRHPYIRRQFDTYYFLWSQAPQSPDVLRPTHDSIVWADTPPTVIDAVLTDKSPPRISIPSTCPTKFRFHNQLGRPVSVVVETTRLGMLPHVLRSFGTVDPGQSEPTYTFQFLPGRYRLRDEISRHTMARIAAR